MSNQSSTVFRERLWPSPWLMVLLLLLLPAVMLTVTPIAAAFAIPIAILVYVLISGSLLLMAPTIRVENGVLTAGSATIEVAALGDIEVLGDAALRRTIGPGADARAFLLVRGNIHRALRIDIRDEKDPTPYWVITTRKPKELASAIDAARALSA